MFSYGELHFRHPAADFTKSAFTVCSEIASYELRQRMEGKRKQRTCKRQEECSKTEGRCRGAVDPVLTTETHGTGGGIVPLFLKFGSG
jgi:hypothetical protein